MLQPVEVPYLPTERVRTLIVGEGVHPFAAELEKMGLTLVYTKPIETLTPPLSAHADLAVCPMTNGRFILEISQQDLFLKLRDLTLKPTFGTARVTSGYPSDAAYNVLQIGAHFLLCNQKTADFSILQYATAQKCAILNCKQGYVKCSVALIRENAVITDDNGIAKILTENGFDVLCIEKGDVRLSGFHYGFIGGCATMLSKTEMLFLGDIRLHRNGDAITGFLRNHGIIPICIEKVPLTDVGSLIPLLQEETIHAKTKMV